jgi:hypothetical protein
MKTPSIAIVCLACALIGCDTPQSPEKPKESPKAQDLTITLGGFIENHPEGGSLGGTCVPDVMRNVLKCDVYNGLQDWTLTEITLVVTWLPYNQDDKRYYRETVSIEPLQTQQVSIRLGLQLPPDDVMRLRNRPPVTSHHWGWTYAGAKGLTRGPH